MWCSQILIFVVVSFQAWGLSSGVTGSGSGAALALWWSAQDITAAALVHHTGDIMLHTTHSKVLCMLCSTQSSVCLGLQQGYGMQLGSPQCHCMPRYLSRHGVKYHLCQRVPELYRDYAMACHGCAMCQKTMVDPICHIYVCLWTWKMQYPVCPVSTAQSFQAIAMNRNRVVMYFCLLEYNWGCLLTSGANFEAGVKNWCSLELHQEGGRWHTEAASLVQSSGSASGRLNHHQH